MKEKVQFYPKELQQKVEKYALQFLSKGRKVWDVPHTKGVVHYAHQIALAHGLNVRVLVTAAYLHDIGYYDLFEDSDSSVYENVKDKKAMHMIVGARLASEFLSQRDIGKYYTEEEAGRIVHLVRVHDKVDLLTSLDEIALMEADTLGAIDISRVTPTFDYEGGMKYIEGLFKKRLPRFRTSTGKKEFDRLIKPFREYFESMNKDLQN